MSITIGVYDKEINEKREYLARTLCELIDDDAPVNWSKYKAVVNCIASDVKFMGNLQRLGYILNCKRQAAKE